MNRVIRTIALAAAIAVSLLAVSGAGGAPQQAPKRGGTLVFAQPQPEPACLNILLPQCGGAGGIQLITAWRLVLEAPFDLGGDLTWRPGLISSATFTTRPPYKLTYRIRPEARWSDGTPVTARDFVFTHAAILRYIHDGPLETLHAEVQSVRAVDPKTVRVTLRSRVGEWRRLFAGIFPAHALAGENLGEVWRDRIDNPKTGRPIGSGPFLVERWDRGRQIVLVRNPRYWGAHRSYVDRLVIRFGVQAGDLPGLMRSGQVHVAYNVPTSLVGELRRDADLELVSGPSTAWERIDFRVRPGGHPLLRKKLVRRAIANGIDRAAIVSRLSAESGLRLRTTSEHDAPDPEPRLPTSLGGLPLPAGGVAQAPRAGRVHEWRRRHLRLRWRSPLAALLHARDPGQYPARHSRADAGAAETRRGRGRADVRPTGRGLRAQRHLRARRVRRRARSVRFESSQGDGTKSLFGCLAEQNFTGYCQRLVTSDLDERRASSTPGVKRPCSTARIVESRRTCPSCRCSSIRSTPSSDRAFAGSSSTAPPEWREPTTGGSTASCPPRAVSLLPRSCRPERRFGPLRSCSARRRGGDPRRTKRLLRRRAPTASVRRA